MILKPIYLKGEFDNRVIGYQIYCPGCECTHEIPIEYGTWMSRSRWIFNGNIERPTFTPSLHIKTGKYVDPNHVDTPGFGELQSVICHSFITDGHIQYLSDCTHKLAGQTVELPTI